MDEPDPRTVRVGDTVVRPAGYWTPAVHTLLDHLEANGFDGAPRAVSRDEDREVVTFVPGETPGPVQVEPWTGDDQLVSVAELVRRYHDAAASFVPPDWASWQPTSVPTTGTLVCHNDLYRGNVVFRNGRAVALIDFDFAHPADPIWDVAIAAWHWVPLTIGAMSAYAPEDRWPFRLRLFVDAYGLPPERRQDVLTTVAEFLRTVRGRAVADGRDTSQTDRDLATLERHHEALAAALAGSDQGLP